MEPLQDIEKAFSNWDKWATYSVAFCYIDEKKARLSDIQDIAPRDGIWAYTFKTKGLQNERHNSTNTSHTTPTQRGNPLGY